MDSSGAVAMSLPFKPGEKIAMPFLPILRVENDVAVLAKKRLEVWAECGARHKVRVETPFFVRGGFRVLRATKYEVPWHAFRVRFKTPYGSFVTEEVPARSLYFDEPPNVRELAERLTREEFGDKVAQIIDVEVVSAPKPVGVYVRKFRHAEVIMSLGGDIIDIRKNYEGNTYFTYEFISENEAKLVDDDRVDYVLHIIGHDQGSRAGCAEIKILSGDVVWSDVKRTCCRIASSAVAMIIARYGSRVVVARNELPYRGCCEEWKIEEWESVVPPRRLASYTATELAVTDLKPEEVV
jgi:hypothetical protein